MRDLKPIAKVAARIAANSKAAPKRKKIIVKAAQVKPGRRFV